MGRMARSARLIEIGILERENEPKPDEFITYYSALARQLFSARNPSIGREVTLTNNMLRVAAIMARRKIPADLALQQQVYRWLGIREIEIGSNEQGRET